MPLKNKRIKNETQPKWLKPELLELIKSRDKLLKKAKRSNSSDYWSDLKRAKNKVTSAIRTAKKNFFHLSFRENHGNQKQLWSIFRNLSGKTKNSDGVIFLEENKAQIRDPVKIAEIFNNYFSNLAKNLADKNLGEFDTTVVSDFVRKHKCSDIKLAFPVITASQTQRLIEAIPSGKATGTDGLSVRLLKIAAPSIAPSLARLINTCIANGTFPSAWKEAKVTPLHKNGSKSDKNNYRPISFLPVLSKVF